MLHCCWFGYGRDSIHGGRNDQGYIACMDHMLHSNWPNCGGGGGGREGGGVSTCTNLAAAAADRLRLLSEVLHVAACCLLLGTATALQVLHSSAAACMTLLPGFCWVPAYVLIWCCSNDMNSFLRCPQRVEAATQTSTTTADGEWTAANGVQSRAHFGPPIHCHVKLNQAHAGTKHRCMQEIALAHLRDFDCLVR